MEQFKFDYAGDTFDVSKISYDLALQYARAKLDRALCNEEIFRKAPVNKEIAEIHYLRQQFLYALFYLNGTERGDIERCIAAFDAGELPPQH